MLRMLSDAQYASQNVCKCCQMIREVSERFGRFQNASKCDHKMFVECFTECVAECFNAFKCFGRFQDAAEGFECLFGIALECFKMLPNKFVFFVNYSDGNSKNFIVADEETSFFLLVSLLVSFSKLTSIFLLLV